MARIRGERAIGLWLDGIGDPGNPKWIVSRDTEDRDGTRDSTTVRIFDEDAYADAKAAALELARRDGRPLIKTEDDGTRKRLWEPEPTETHACARCGRDLPVADDQTDPGDDEVAVDARGLVSPDAWVCGACIADAE